MRLLEGAFIEASRREVADAGGRGAERPRRLRRVVRGAGGEWPRPARSAVSLARRGSPAAEMRWFLLQEVGRRGRLRRPGGADPGQAAGSAKLELARNYWDEMGRGNAKGMHGPHAGERSRRISTLVPRSAAWSGSRSRSANMMVALATNRRYAYQSIGALGVIELTAPGRAALVNEGLRRLGVSGEAAPLFRAARHARREALAMRGTPR